MNAIDWLLAPDSDPAIRWQAMRDLGNASEEQIAKERARVVDEGLGALILGAQGEDGAWHRNGEPDWLPTLFMPLLLRSTGVDPHDPKIEAAMSRLAAGFRWPEDVGLQPFFEGETEPCINGGTLALGGYFGRPSESLVRRLLGEQLADGGWNCDAPQSVVSSYHSTICVLEGLLEYERAVGAAPDITAARKRGEEYLLERGLFRRRSNGEVANTRFLELGFPPRYHYDILRALEYFRAAGARPDARMAAAIRMIESKRTAEGTWLLDRAQGEAHSIELQESVGAPSRWITLRALRVLSWYSRT